MAVDRGYVHQNTTERERLRRLVDRLGDADLERPVGAGWTVASVLAHLAFWDQRALVLLERWERGGAGTSVPRIRNEDVDWINDSVKPLILALPPRAAARLAVTTAEAIDRKAGSLTDAQVAAMAAAGQPVNLLRAEHRREHLDDIERALGRELDGGAGIPPATAR